MTGRRALITGGARGIGAAIAEVFRNQGAVVDTPTRQLLPLDDVAATESWLREHASHPFDILVNCAGINQVETISALSPASLRTMHLVNVEAPLRLMQAFVPGMAARGWGRVVNVSSIWALNARAGRAGYAATKAGIIAATRVAAVEYAASGVLINAVCPGYVATEMTARNNPPEVLADIATRIPMRRLAEPREVAELVAWLCSGRNGYLTGQAVTIDGGYTAE